MDRAERGWETVDLAPVEGAVTRTIVSLVKEVPRQERAIRAFVVSRNHREPLPMPPSNNGIQTPLSQFLFSPDEGMLVAQRWFSSTNGQTFFYRRSSKLGYALVTKKSLEERIGEQFGGPTEWSVQTSPNHLALQCWLSSGELLTGCYYGTHRVGINYQVVLEPRTGKLRSWKLLEEGRVLYWPEKLERYPQTRLRPMTWREVEDWSYPELHYAINEMYARRRYSFNGEPKAKAQLAKLGFYLDSKRNKASVERMMWLTEYQNLQLLTRRSLLKPQRKNR